MAKKKIGLALSGGGARGFAHIGVIKALEANGIAVDIVGGTSAGSFVGGALASGLSAKELLEIGRQIGWLSVTGISYSPKALLSNAAMGKFIKRNFPTSRIENLAIPFAAVTCDLKTGEEFVFRDRGDLATAIRASCAVPGIFRPVADDGRLLIDGGVLTPMPAQIVKEMGADVVIGVDLISCGASFRKLPKTALGMLFQSAMILLQAASRNQNYRGDIVIEPKIAHLRPDEIGRREELIKLGEKAALEKIGEIVDRINSRRLFSGRSGI